MTYKFLGGLIGCLLLLPGTASAARVSVEVEGLSVTVPPTVVDTPATVSKGGDTCADGANVLGALDVLTRGDWDGSQYGATRILVEDHPFIPGDAGWVFVVNGRARADYGCTAPVQDGDRILWYASDGFGAYKVDKGFDDPVLLDATATAVPGQAFTVTATNTDTSYDSGGTPTGTAFSPSAGATVSGGAAAATTGADGKAQVTVPGGPYTLVATKDRRAPARIAGCATNGHDGFCGTTASSTGTTTTTTPSAAAPCVTNGHDGFCGTSDRTAPSAKITAIAEGRRFAKGKGPRQLGGTVAADGSGVADIQLRLTRNDRGKCSTYDGRTEKFKTIKKCGATHGTWFSAGSNAAWSYLLPSALGRGRYVLDVIAIDKAGNKVASLARGTTRVVFTVA
ncbi:hypothetical protein [Conexibacter woesei]|uniref:hypothetical protein n=1 Tax=Conexibacter woesei TaxID=191495 RepID=UPI000427ACA9|nr:hypothetical protein [Conexibacter woesei]